MYEFENYSIKEAFDTRFDKDKMITYISSSSERKKEALHVALEAYEPESWRACWILRKVFQKNDEILLPFVDKVIRVAHNRTDGHTRELLKLLELVDLTDEQEGSLFELCLMNWSAISKQSSVRHTSFVHLLNIAKKYPELISEIEPKMSSDYLQTLSPGIRRSVKKQWDRHQIMN